MQAIQALSYEAILYAGQPLIYDHQKPMHMGEPRKGCKGVIFHLKFKRKYGNTLLKDFKYDAL